MTASDVPRSRTIGNTIRKIEMRGYATLAGALSGVQVEEIRSAVSNVSLQCSSYTEKQWFAHGAQWLEIPAVWNLIKHPPVVEFLRHLFGDDIVCIGVSISRSDPRLSRHATAHG